MNIATMNMLGVEIVTSAYLTVPKVVFRTRRERWLSWPWRPWATTKVTQVPDPMVYRINADPRRPKFYAHPETARRLREASVLGVGASLSRETPDP